MAQTKNLCFEEHICRACKEVCKCGTYTWACPWRNDDEDQMCGACMEEFAEDYNRWYNEQ